jgi:hypothetical protein
MEMVAMTNELRSLVERWLALSKSCKGETAEDEGSSTTYFICAMDLKTTLDRLSATPGELVRKWDARIKTLTGEGYDPQDLALLVQAKEELEQSLLAQAGSGLPEAILRAIGWDDEEIELGPEARKAIASVLLAHGVSERASATSAEEER